MTIVTADINVKQIGKTSKFWLISKFPLDIFVRTDDNPEVELTSVKGAKIGFTSVCTGNRKTRRAFLATQRYY